MANELKGKIETDAKGTAKLAKSGLKSVLTQHPAGLGETNDCFVLAIASVTGVPYSDAHTFTATKFGRKPRGATYTVVETMQDIDTKRECVFGYRAFGRLTATGTRTRLVRSFGRCAIRKYYSYPTLTEFARRHKTGRFLLWSNAHAFACIDGVIYDNGAAGPRTNVTGCYEFIPSSKCEAAVAALGQGAGASERIKAEASAR